MTSDGGLDTEIFTRIYKATVAFGNLHKRLWDDHDVSLKTKVAVYQASIIPTLLYGCESWTPYRRQISYLDSFHMRRLRTICKESWDDKVKNSEILSRCNISGIESFLIRAQTRWTGHVIRMDETRIPKQLFYGQIPNAPRKIGRPLLRYKDKLKDNLKHLDLLSNTWEKLPHDRSKWRQKCFSRITKFEEKRVKEHDERYVRAKISRAMPIANPLFCTTCGKACRTKAGLASHTRSHIVYTTEDLTCGTCKNVS